MEERPRLNPEEVELQIETSIVSDVLSSIQNTSEDVDRALGLKDLEGHELHSSNPDDDDDE